MCQGDDCNQSMCWGKQQELICPMEIGVSSNCNLFRGSWCTCGLGGLTALVLDPVVNLFVRVLVWGKKKNKTWNAKNLGLCPHLPESLTAFDFLCNFQQSAGWIILLFHLLSMQKIGDSYRGYCVSETELESVLTLHKQQTQSVWGTRQSPSPAKPATRLMWKSQYVPYDGIPFVNAGN